MGDRSSRWGLSSDMGGIRPYFYSLLIGFFCLTISLLSFVIIHDREESQRRMTFDQRARVHAAALQGQIDRDLEIVHSIARFYAASTLVTREEFGLFVQQTLRRHPEVQALEWVPLVRHWERPRYEDPARHPELESYRITELDSLGRLVEARQREEYYPVYFLEPLVGNERALGFDLGSEPNRLAALERARDTGLPVTTEPVRLIQEPGFQPGVIVFFPIYRKGGLEETVEARREGLKGYAAGVFRVEDLFDLMLPMDPADAMNFRLLDVTDSEQPQVIFEPDYNERQVPEDPEWPQALEMDFTPGFGLPVNIPDRTWILQFQPRKASFQQEYLQPSWGILLFGTIFTILLTSYLISRTRHALGMQALEGDLSKTSRELERGLAERKRATRALKKSEARFGAVFEHGQYAIAVADAQGRLIDFNPAFQNLLGYPDDELRMIHFKDLTHEDDRPESLHLFQQLVQKVIPQFEMEKRYVRQDGEIIWCRTGVSALYNDLGEFEAAISMLVDVTSRKIAEKDREDLQQQLLHTQKMEAIGRLAGGIAHDFNNLLTVMRGYTSLSLEQVPPNDSVHGYLEEMEKATARAESLTRQLLAFGRKQFLRPRVLDINEIVVNMEKMLGRLIGEDVELVTDLNPGVMKVKADIGQMEQVIMNLAVNARDAMPEGGRLTIETRNVSVRSHRKQSGPDIPPGEYAALVMRDTGEGIDPATIEKIFEPFFTTKEVGAGTGLGLATVYGVMSQSGGHVGVESKVGQGSTFTIYLPGTEAAPEAEASAPVVRDTGGGDETILLVEDEAMVRQVTRDTLVSFGYHVLDAGNGPEALRICKSYDGAIHLILTDVIMPGMNGLELVAAAAPYCPEAKVIYMSGYTGGRIGQNDALDGNTLFLTKPFRPSVLGEKIREALGSG